MKMIGMETHKGRVRGIFNKGKRALIEEGYSSRMEKKAAKEYAAGRITMGKAAEKAGMAVW